MADRYLPGTIVFTGADKGKPGIPGHYEPFHIVKLEHGDNWLHMLGTVAPPAPDLALHWPQGKKRSDRVKLPQVITWKGDDFVIIDARRLEVCPCPCQGKGDIYKVEDEHGNHFMMFALLRPRIEVSVAEQATLDARQTLPSHLAAVQDSLTAFGATNVSFHAGNSKQSDDSLPSPPQWVRFSVPATDEVKEHLDALIGQGNMYTECKIQDIPHQKIQVELQKQYEEGLLVEEGFGNAASNIASLASSEFLRPLCFGVGLALGGYFPKSNGYSLGGQSRTIACGGGIMLERVLFSRALPCRYCTLSHSGTVKGDASGSESSASTTTSTESRTGGTLGCPATNRVAVVLSPQGHVTYQCCFALPSMHTCKMGQEEFQVLDSDDGSDQDYDMGTLHDDIPVANMDFVRDAADRVAHTGRRPVREIRDLQKLYKARGILMPVGPKFKRQMERNLVPLRQIYLKSTGDVTQVINNLKQRDPKGIYVVIDRVKGDGQEVDADEAEIPAAVICIRSKGVRMCGKLQLFGLDSTHFKFLTGSDDQDVFVLGGFPRGSVKIAGVFFLKKGSGKYIATALSRIQEEAAKLGHKFSPKSFFTDDSPAEKNGLMGGLKELENLLLCVWHLDQRLVAKMKKNLCEKERVDKVMAAFKSAVFAPCTPSGVETIVQACRTSLEQCECDEETIQEAVAKIREHVQPDDATIKHSNDVAAVRAANPQLGRTNIASLKEAGVPASLVKKIQAANKSWRTRTVKKKRAQLAAFSASGRVKAQKGSAKSPKLSKKKLQEQKQAQLEKDKVQKAKVASDVDKVADDGPSVAASELPQSEYRSKLRPRVAAASYEDIDSGLTSESSDNLDSEPESDSSELEDNSSDSDIGSDIELETDTSGSDSDEAIPVRPAAAGRGKEKRQVNFRTTTGRMDSDDDQEADPQATGPDDSSKARVKKTMKPIICYSCSEVFQSYAARRAHDCTYVDSDEEADDSDADVSPSSCCKAGQCVCPNVTSNDGTPGPCLHPESVKESEKSAKKPKSRPQVSKTKSPAANSSMRKPNFARAIAYLLKSIWAPDRMKRWLPAYLGSIRNPVSTTGFVEAAHNIIKYYLTDVDKLQHTIAQAIAAIMEALNEYDVACKRKKQEAQQKLFTMQQRYRHKGEFRGDFLCELAKMIDPSMEKIGVDCLQKQLKVLCSKQHGPGGTRDDKVFPMASKKAYAPTVRRFEVPEGPGTTATDKAFSASGNNAAQRVHIDKDISKLKPFSKELAEAFYGMYGVCISGKPRAEDHVKVTAADSATKRDGGVNSTGKPSAVTGSLQIPCWLVNVDEDGVTCRCEVNWNYGHPCWHSFGSLLDIAGHAYKHYIDSVPKDRPAENITVKVLARFIFTYFIDVPNRREFRFRMIKPVTVERHDAPVYEGFSVVGSELEAGSLDHDGGGLDEDDILGDRANTDAQAVRDAKSSRRAVNKARVTLHETLEELSFLSADASEQIELASGSLCSTVYEKSDKYVNKTLTSRLPEILDPANMDSVIRLIGRNQDLVQQWIAALQRYVPDTERTGKSVTPVPEPEAVVAPSNSVFEPEHSVRESHGNNGQPRDVSVQNRMEQLHSELNNKGAQEGTHSRTVLAETPADLKQGLADSASQCDDDCDTGIEYEGEYHYQGDDDDVDDTMESLEVPTVNSARELLLLGQTDPTRTVSSQDGLEVAPNNAELEAVGLDSGELQLQVSVRKASEAIGTSVNPSINTSSPAIVSPAAEVQESHLIVANNSGNNPAPVTGLSALSTMTTTALAPPLTTSISLMSLATPGVTLSGSKLTVTQKPRFSLSLRNRKPAPIGSGSTESEPVLTTIAKPVQAVNCDPQSPQLVKLSHHQLASNERGPTLAAVSPSDSHHSLFQTPQALRTTITASPSGTADNPEQNTSISFVNAVKSVLPTPPASEIPKVVTPHAVQISATRLKFAGMVSGMGAGSVSDHQQKAMEGVKAPGLRKALLKQPLVNRFTESVPSQPPQMTRKSSESPCDGLPATNQSDAATSSSAVQILDSIALPVNRGDFKGRFHYNFPHFGNTCFIASTLHCLLRTANIRDVLEAQVVPHQSKCPCGCAEIPLETPVFWPEITSNLLATFLDLLLLYGDGTAAFNAAHPPVVSSGKGHAKLTKSAEHDAIQRLSSDLIHPFAHVVSDIGAQDNRFRREFYWRPPGWNDDDDLFSFEGGETKQEDAFEFLMAVLQCLSNGQYAIGKAREPVVWRFATEVLLPQHETEARCSTDVSNVQDVGGGSASAADVAFIDNELACEAVHAVALQNIIETSTVTAMQSLKQHTVASAPVERKFQALTRKLTMCNNPVCGRVSLVFETTKNLQLHLPPGASGNIHSWSTTDLRRFIKVQPPIKVSDLVRQRVQSSKLPEHSCIHCGAKGHCEESEVVVQLPDTLCLCLTRFANVEVGYKVDKNNRPLAKVIKMTNKVDISDAADPDGFDLGILLGGASRLYKLFAVLAHRGSSRTSGHYVTYVPSNPQDAAPSSGTGSTWVCLDDLNHACSRTRIPAATLWNNEAFQQDAYILWFEKLPSVLHEPLEHVQGVTAPCAALATGSTSSWLSNDPPLHGLGIVAAAGCATGTFPVVQHTVFEDAIPPTGTATCAHEQLQVADFESSTLANTATAAASRTLFPRKRKNSKPQQLSTRKVPVRSAHVSDGGDGDSESDSSCDAFQSTLPVLDSVSLRGKIPDSKFVDALALLTGGPSQHATMDSKRGVLQKLAAKLQSRETYFEGPLAPNVLAENVKDEEWIALAHSLRPRTRKRQCTARRADQLEAESKIPENIRAPLSSVSRRNLCNLVTDNALLNDEWMLLDILQARTRQVVVIDSLVWEEYQSVLFDPQVTSTRLAEAANRLLRLLIRTGLRLQEMKSRFTVGGASTTSKDISFPVTVFVIINNPAGVGHWFLAELRMETKQVYVWDSMGTASDKTIVTQLDFGRLLEVALCWGLGLNPLHLSKAPWAYVMHNPSPKQGATNLCGTYVICNLQCRMHDRMPKYAKKQAEAARFRILGTLVDRSPLIQVEESSDSSSP